MIGGGGDEAADGEDDYQDGNKEEVDVEEVPKELPEEETSCWLNLKLGVVGFLYLEGGC